MARPIKGAPAKDKRRPPRPLHIVLDDLDFIWQYETAKHVREMWQKGNPLSAISLTVARDMDEVALLVMDLARKNWRIMRQEIYIALDGLDFSWYFDEVKRVEKMWAQGWPLEAIAENVQRITDEVALLVMDLAIKDQIIPREKGVGGAKK